MQLTRKQLVLIDRLLLKREAAFTRIYELETSINNALTVPYPLPLPPCNLPSLQKKRTAKSKAVEKQSSKGSSTLLKLPTLKSEEQFYTLHYEQEGHHYSEDHRDVKALQTVLANETQDFRILKIETK